MGADDFDPSKRQQLTTRAVVSCLRKVIPGGSELHELEVPESLQFLNLPAAVILSPAQDIAAVAANLRGAFNNSALGKSLQASPEVWHLFLTARGCTALADLRLVIWTSDPTSLVQIFVAHAVRATIQIKAVKGRYLFVTSGSAIKDIRNSETTGY